MPATPIPSSAVIYINKSDENDPESPIEAYLVTVENGEHKWESLAWTLPNSDPAKFIWFVKSAAEFHNLHVQNESGIED